MTGPEQPVEVGLAAEPGPLGHPPDRVRGRGQQHRRVREADPVDELDRPAAEVLGHRAGQMPVADRRELQQPRQALAQVLLATHRGAGPHEPAGPDVNAPRRLAQDRHHRGPQPDDVQRAGRVLIRGERIRHRLPDRVGRSPREHRLRREIPGRGHRHPGEVGEREPLLARERDVDELELPVPARAEFVGVLRPDQDEIPRRQVLAHPGYLLPAPPPHDVEQLVEVGVRVGEHPAGRIGNRHQGRVIGPAVRHIGVAQPVHVKKVQL